MLEKHARHYSDAELPLARLTENTFIHRQGGLHAGWASVVTQGRKLRRALCLGFNALCMYWRLGGLEPQLTGGPAHRQPGFPLPPTLPGYVLHSPSLPPWHPSPHFSCSFSLPSNRCCTLPLLGAWMWIWVGSRWCRHPAASQGTLGSGCPFHGQAVPLYVCSAGH